MTKHAKATGLEDITHLDPQVVEFLRHDVSPEVAGRAAATEVFEGISAEIMAFVTQQKTRQLCTE